MALPKLNSITYKLNLPSTGDSVKFRPFLVKEQKALMVQLNLLCPDDEKTRVDVEIDLGDVDIQMSKDHTNVIQLTKDISVIMKYPTLSDMEGFGDTEGQVSSVFTMMKRCINEVHDGETIYNKVDISEKELDEFIESMSTENFENFSTFFETMPKLQHVVEVKNPKTKKKNEILIEGLQSFFG